jgi:hypothetical protein
LPCLSPTGVFLPTSIKEKVKLKTNQPRRGQHLNRASTTRPSPAPSSTSHGASTLAGATSSEANGVGYKKIIDMPLFLHSLGALWCLVKFAIRNSQFAL